MIAFGDRQLAAIRAGLAVVVVFDAVSLAWRTREDVVGSPWNDGSGWARAIAESAPLTWGIALLAVAGAVWFFARPRSLGPGLVALVAVRFLHEAFEAVRGVFHENYYHAGAALLGWCIGRGVARVWRVTALEAERLAATIAAGTFGATYVNAGLSKLRTSGVDWATSDVVRLSVIRHIRMDDWEWRAALARALVDAPALGWVISIMTLVIELAGIAMIAPGRLRAWTASAIVALHFGIWLFTGIAFVEAIAIAILLGWPARGSIAGYELISRPRAWAPAILAVLVAVAALLLPVPPRVHRADLAEARGWITPAR